MKYFNFFAAILLSLLYATGKIPPSERFNLWFSIFIIPVAMVFNTVLFIVAMVMKKKSAFYYIIPMIIGAPYLISTVGVKRYFKSGDVNTEKFTIMNYNISRLTVKQGQFSNPDSARLALRELIINPVTDIQCYQEFVNLPRTEMYNIIAELDARKMHFYFSMEDESIHSVNARAGILIVSKFPILDGGDLLSSNNGFNRVAYADLRIGVDTIRIINAHLESMGLSRYDPRYQSHDVGITHTTQMILRKLKFGVFERSKQVQQIAAFISTSPYPVICAGDFNDMPYSYSYQYLKWRMKNSFEESGQGFGFTYNGGTLRTLRIDNQFYAGRLKSTDLVTRYDLPFTDHFPVIGTYSITPRSE